MLLQAAKSGCSRMQGSHQTGMHNTVAAVHSCMQIPARGNNYVDGMATHMQGAFLSTPLGGVCLHSLVTASGRLAATSSSMKSCAQVFTKPDVTAILPDAVTKLWKAHPINMCRVVTCTMGCCDSQCCNCAGTLHRCEWLLIVTAVQACYGV